MARGRFITFEGGEGTGKSTQARLLAARLRRHNLDIVETREPGGEPLGERVRRLLLAGEVKALGAEAETLLFYAARERHIGRVIAPALEAGRWVLCDRFFDSTRAYQGGGGRVATALIDALDQAVVANTKPDLTIVLDVDAEQGLARARRRGAADRFEGEDVAFHARLRQAFLEIAKREPERCLVFQTTDPREDVSQRIWTAVAMRFAL